jgi:DNA end-binding protein Ku
MEEDEDVIAGPRPIWSGTLAFGLISLPVSLFPANRGRPLSLKMVDPDGTPLARRYFCEKEGKALPADEIVRGYKLDDEHYVVVEDDELDSLAPERSREIDLRQFVRLDAVDPIYFERAYFLTPDEGATKAYRLLAKSMEDEQRAGIARFVMRGKEYLCAIVAEHGILRAETLRFHDEVRSPDMVGLPARKEPSKAALKRMQQAVKALATKKFDRAELTDDYIERLRAHVEKKLAAGRDVIRAPEEVAAAPSEDSNVVDLMQVLKERLQGRAPPADDKPATSRRPGRTAGAESGSKTRQKATPHRPDRSAGERPAKASRLKQLSRSELYARAQKLDLAGRSQMSKTQLVDALSQRG